MRDRLFARTEADQKAITTVRELYDLWVECSEEVYAKNVLTDEYAEMHGEMVNALMALKHQGAQMMDDLAGALNMPTRQEMDTIHLRFQTSRRNNQTLRKEVATLKARQDEQSNQIDRLLNKVEELEKGTIPKVKKKSANKGKKSPKTK